MANYPELYGWDTVFAISIDNVNVALAKLPATDVYVQSTQITGGETIEISFALQNWKLIDTPGGNQLVLSIEFASNSVLTLTNKPAVSLEGWSLTVTFAAAFEATDSTNQKLKAVITTGSKWANSVAISAPQGTPFTQESYVQTVMSNWLNQSSDAMSVFDKEFMTVNIGKQIGTGALSWLQPARLGFAGAVMQDGVTKALGILAMTDPSKDPAAATLELSPYAILPGATAGYVVSRDLVLTNLIMPACAAAFSDDQIGDTADFELYLVGQENQLRNAHDLSFHHDLDGTSQQAGIAAHALNASLDGDTLTLDINPMNIQTSYPGVSLDVSISEDLVMSLVPNPGDKKQMTFILSNKLPSRPQVSSRLSKEAKAASIALDVLVAAISAALMVVTFKGPLAQKLSTTSAKIWARIIAAAIGMVGLVAASTEEWIALAQSGKTHDIPDFAPFITAGLGGIRLPGGTQAKFDAIAGQFANGMLISIEPHF